MKCNIPQISWHCRDPVLSIDFQPFKGNKLRLASGGTDSHVLIWYITYQENKSINIECASDLYRHNKSVNVVRFSPNGDLLASGDDEGALFLWQLKERDNDAPKDEDDANQEEWYPLKLLRGHLEDIYDLSWSADGNFLVSASMDNTAIMWDMQKFQKVHIFSDSKGYVQGVAWDPLNKYIGTIGMDRILRIMNINTKKTAFQVKRAPWSVTTEKGTIRSKLFYDDTLKSYFRRLCFTPDGELLLVPSGILEKDNKFVNVTYVFSRHYPNKPVAYLPTGDKYTVAVRCNPLFYKLRGSMNKENNESKVLINLPYRMIFAVAACDSVLIYDTEQLVPIAYVSNIHYTHLTDLTWSSDGHILVASSTDGYCSFIIFSDKELGEVYVPPAVESPKKEEPKLLLQSTKEDSKNVIEQDNTEKPIKKVSEKEKELIDLVPKCTVMETEKISLISPKNDKSVVNLKKEPKKPKLTIESFFVSPKAKLSVNLANKQEISSLKNDVLKDSNSDNIKLDSTVKFSTQGDGPKTSDSNTEKHITSLNKNELIEMDTALNEACSIELIYETEKLKTTTLSENNSKCSVQLNFANKLQLGDKIVKESSTSDLNDNVATLYKSSQCTSDDIKENDWKLELSQDEDIVPMDTSESGPSKEEIKASTSQHTTFKEDKINTIEISTKSKRRINFITLSKTVNKIDE